MVSQQDTQAPKPDKHFVDATEGHSGSVMVISAPHGTFLDTLDCSRIASHKHRLPTLFTDTRSAVWGGLMTNRAQFNGIQGVVLSGRCRDLQEQWDAGFPVRRERGKGRKACFANLSTPCRSLHARTLRLANRLSPSLRGCRACCGSAIQRHRLFQSRKSILET